MPLHKSAITEFETLCRKTSEIHAEWKMYRHLFADYPEHFELFNTIDPGYFVVVEHLFLEHFCMFICRMGDPSSQNGNRNLTLETLAQLAVKEEPSSGAALSIKLDHYRSSIQTFRDLRNKIYGHPDYDRSLRTKLTLYSRSDMETALSSLREFMNEFRAVFGMSTMLYNQVITVSNGEGLITALKSKLS